MTAVRPLPVAVRLVAPLETDTSALVVALTAALRSHGVRVGTATVRPSLGGGAATVLVTGSGARMTLPGAPPSEVLRGRAAALDPGLDLLIVEGAVDEHDLPTIEVTAPGRSGSSEPSMLGTVDATLLDGAGPMEDFGLAQVIEERLLAGIATPGGLAEAAQAPIESQRRLLDRSGLSPPPRGRAASGWRRWFRR